ncbi:[citrate (pro-3S)-lyase] ligase [Kineosphaera limosa]|uniref:Citrate lyase ligase n=1 Tax=Kineosphaera limosa NBRC 100340 TaxID=1184609 RepID=K6XB32_9MICO|nr:[citrate (pro-3S)-lyase] ligase [Kineosphaera limosa]NYE02439.1 [citrate (pro-3S)-lyase] ligase [Kineosphaera limosa]GAB96034.1 citrate lyase ligase [Kineosphaera limosa NBRC 100340]
MRVVNGLSPWDSDVSLGTLIPAVDPAGLTQVAGLLATRGLGLDADIEVFVTAHADGRLIGCMGLAGVVVKCAAIDEDAQGAGIAARLMERLNYEALDRGRANLFVFTTPCNRAVFETLGFTTLAHTSRAVLLENTPFGLADYRRELRRHRRAADRVGAIVLNANPFTLGHRHLVSIAADALDVLHVFVVAEDASLFGTDERLRLVRAGVAELGLGDRVVVHPGSRYIVSRATFPDYFLTRESERDDAAAGLDLQLFRTAIAPELGVTDRFVGTEPYSAVTAAYNDQMRRWLAAPVMPTPSPLQLRPPSLASTPTPGLRRQADAPAITVHEVPRLELDGMPISASRVRDAIGAGDLNAAARLVPTPTLESIRTLFFADSQEPSCE